MHNPKQVNATGSNYRRIRNTLQLAIPIAFAVAAGNASAANPPQAVGGVLQINSPDSTIIVLQQPMVAVRSDGSFIVVWSQSNGDQQTQTSKLYMRLFDASGAPLGAESVLTTDFGTQPSIAVDGSGNFAVGWLGSASGPITTHVRLFQANGTPRGGEFCVDPACQESAVNFRLAMDDAGDFVVAQELGDKSQSFSSTGINLRRFDANGQPTDSSPVQIYSTPPRSSSTYYNTSLNGAAMNPATGDVAVVWHTYSNRLSFLKTSTTEKETVQLSRLTADASSPATPTQVSSCSQFSVITGSTSGCNLGIFDIHHKDALAYTAKGITLTWPRVSFGSASEVFYQRSYSATTGKAAGLAVKVPVPLYGTQGSASALDPDANLVNVWEQFSSDFSVYLQATTAKGSALGAAQQVGSNFPERSDIAVAVSAQDQLVVIWADNQAQALYAQRYSMQ